MTQRVSETDAMMPDSEVIMTRHIMMSYSDVIPGSQSWKLLVMGSLTAGDISHQISWSFHHPMVTHMGSHSLVSSGLAYGGAILLL